MRDVTKENPRPAAPLLASVLVHAAAVVALLTLSFTTQTPAPPLQRARAVMLLAPVPPPRRASPPLHLKTAEIPREHTLQARHFYAPAVLATPIPPRELLPAPAIDIPRPLLPSPERQIAVLPAPPLRTDNFTSSVAAAQVAAPRAMLRSAGFTGVTSPTQLQVGILRRAGFDSASAADTATPARLLAHAGFGDATISTGPGAVASVTVSPVTRPLEILSKPKPVYTAEARARRIEGEVLLQVLFAASGPARVLSTVRGLGYGLDENAVAAAQAIRFRPVERAGLAADSTAIVHIVFQLAY